MVIFKFVYVCVYVCYRNTRYASSVSALRAAVSSLNDDQEEKKGLNNIVSGAEQSLSSLIYPSFYISKKTMNKLQQAGSLQNETKMQRFAHRRTQKPPTLRSVS